MRYGRRRHLSRRHSRKSFKKGFHTRRKNHYSPMRGGIRL